MTYFYWHDDHIQTFVSAKSALQQLTFSDPLAKLSFAVDASKMAIGVVLQHWPLILEFCSPISFAAYSAVKYFDYMLAGRDFYYLYHKPLTFLSTGTQNSCLSIKQIHAYQHGYYRPSSYLGGDEAYCYNGRSFLTLARSVSGRLY